MDAANVGQLLSTVVSLDEPPRRRHVGLLSIAIVLYFVGWTAFLSVLTISRLHQPASLYTNIPNYTVIPNDVPWFNLSDGIFICLGFMIPAVAVAFTIFLDWLRVRHWRQAYACAMILRSVNEDITPRIAPHWSPPLSEQMTTTFKDTNQVGWESNGRLSRIWHIFVNIAVLTTICATALVNQTHSYSTGNQPIDFFTPLVAGIVITLLIILWVRMITRNWSAVLVDEMGLTLPPSNVPHPTRHILWQDVRALYRVELSERYWLLLTNEHLYCWMESLTDIKQQGIRLAQTIVARTKAPVYDATILCKLASGTSIPAIPVTPEFALFDRWQQALDMAKQHDTRRPLSFTPAIILAVVGLMMGVAATFIIAYFAAAWATRV